MPRTLLRHSPRRQPVRPMGRSLPAARNSFSLDSLVGQAPTLDTAGIHAQNVTDIDRDTRLRGEQTAQALRRVTGPRATSVASAVAPARFGLEGMREKTRSAQKLGMAKGDFDLRGFIASLQAAGGERGRILQAGEGQKNRDLRLLIEKMNQPGWMDILGAVIGGGAKVGAAAIGRG